MDDVAKKAKDGYRLVKFDDVNDKGGLRGKVMQTLVEKNYYNQLKLDGGQITLKRLCKDDSCNKESTRFELQSGKNSSIQVGSRARYAAMIGR